MTIVRVLHTGYAHAVCVLSQLLVANDSLNSINYHEMHT